MNRTRIIVLSIIFSTLFFLCQNKELNPVFTVSAQTCTTPTQVTNVAITFPSCVGNVCNFTQGSCKWDALTDAANYNVIITEVETGTVVTNQQIASGTITVTFPVTQSNTYKCDVSAINSCGTAGPAGTASLLCKVDAGVIATPTPTPVPTQIPVITPAPTSVPMPITGNEMPLMIFSAAAIAMIIGGIKAFKF